MKLNQLVLNQSEDFSDQDSRFRSTLPGVGGMMGGLPNKANFATFYALLLKSTATRETAKHDFAPLPRPRSMGLATFLPVS